MSAEDEINLLKQIPPKSNLEMKRARRTAIVLATTTIISILFFIYAFLQKQEADKQAEQAMEFRVIAEKAQSEAKAAQVEAEKLREVAMLAQAEAEKQRMQAEQALADCKGVKRK